MNDIPGQLEAFRQLRALEEQMTRWRMLVLTYKPTLNADHVRTVCEEIVRRATHLSTISPLRHEEVAKFLLERSLRWIIAGEPFNSIGGKLPKTLNELGMLRLAEGRPITDSEIAAIKNVKRPILH